MTREAQLIQDRYDALMFAKNPAQAQEAARALARTVLGAQADQLSLEEAMRSCCRKLRPAADPREQARFETEFLELALGVFDLHHAAA
jgi:hypothetical protein